MATEHQQDAAEVVDLLATVRTSAVQGAIWSHAGDDLNANLVRLDTGESVGGHVNDAVDVLLIGLLGEGTVELDGRWHRVGAGQLLVLPKGALRAIEAGEGGFAYLTCHRRRPGLWPENRARPGAGDAARP
jgi:quercetin dioxygenase-like cupin family protein